MKLSTNQIRGLVIYPLGDAIAQLILGDINLLRVLVLSLVGGFIYSYEIGKWFGYIQQKFKQPLVKTAMAVLYFNPLWIARHFLFIELVLNPELFFNASTVGEQLTKILVLGLKSFAGGVLVSLIANYLIQNKVPLNYRFLLSATFSALMGIYYALSKVWF